MRLLTTLGAADEVNKITSYLGAQGIENTVDIETNRDWGSDDYGTDLYKIWIIDEDQTDNATKILQEFLANPRDPKFQKQPPKTTSFPLHASFKPNELKKSREIKRRNPGKLTLFIIAFCAFIYLFGAITSPSLESGSSQSYFPIYTAPIKQALLFDFPAAYEILNELITKFGVDSLQDSSHLPPEGALLVKKFQQTPWWQGIYQEAVSYFQTGMLLPEAPWFEKIQQGEIWRLISPIFLHGDIFHILFNMAWAYILGRQLEVQLKPLRYLLFILIAAIFSNTIQYLISGPNFIGYSGVVCAMLAFAWERQKAAPWEGYQLQKSTFTFMMIFIFGMLGLQTLSFFIEITAGQTLPTSIANGAHIAGLVIGWLLSKTPYFTAKAA